MIVRQNSLSCSVKQLFFSVFLLSLKGAKLLKVWFITVYVFYRKIPEKRFAGVRETFRGGISKKSFVKIVSWASEISFDWYYFIRGQISLSLRKKSCVNWKTKTEINPLCLMQKVSSSPWWCSRLKIPEQAQIFSATCIITLSGFRINHKAINRNKNHQLVYKFFHDNRDNSDNL